MIISSISEEVLIQYDILSILHNLIQFLSFISLY